MHDGGTGVCEYFVIAGVTVFVSHAAQNRILCRIAFYVKNAIELYRQMRNRLREILSAVLQQG